MKSWRRYARFFGTDVDRDVEEELRFHFDQLVDNYMGRGFARDAAESAAHERLGDLPAVEHELKAHDRARAKRLTWHEAVERIQGDVRLAVRSLRRSPAFTFTVVAILALAIGMSTAMFVVYKTVLVDRLPIAAQDQVIVMHPLDRKGMHLDVPYPYLATIARDSALFRGVAGTAHLGAYAIPFMDGSATIKLGAVPTSANYFDVFGMRPAIGRLFRAEDGRAGAPLVLVLSYAGWRRRWGGDSTVIGRTLTVPNMRQQVRIVGVAPPGFEYPHGTEGWVPILPGYTGQVDIIARLAPHATIDVARSNLLALMRRENPFVLEAPGKPLATSGVSAQPFAENVLGASRPTLVALTLAAALLLLIACVNVGTLELVRLLGRHREIAVRRAIGASYADVARLFVVEGGLLGAAGGLFGLLAALVLVRVAHAITPAKLPRSDALGAVGVPVGVAAAVTLLSILIFALPPSLAVSRVNSYVALRANARTGDGGSRRRAGRWLVTSQIALAVVMLSGAAMLVRSLARLQSMDLGYQPDHLSVLSFTAPPDVAGTEQKLTALASALIARVEATPGVVAAATVENAPFRGQTFFITQIAPAEAPISEHEHAPFIPFEFVGAHYFRTFGIPIHRGRAFTTADTRGSARVVVINESLARQFWPNEDAMGKQLRSRDNSTGNNATWTVIGIASDTHLREFKNVGPVVYFDVEQRSLAWNGDVAVRTTGSLGAALPALRAAARDVDPSLVLWNTQTMDQLLDAPLAQPRSSALLLTGFSLVALLLSAIGLYGVTASAVRQQTRDIGVRIALGATHRDVRRLVLGDAVRVVGFGALAGIVGAFAAGRVLASQLFGVSPTDPLSIGAAATALVAVGIIAAYGPARRAMRIDPAQALRAD